MENSIHQFSVKDITGKSVDLEKYKGKVLLIVNTASKCGFTPQLESMEKLYEEFRDEDFEILAFPSNDFGGQEPLNGEEIQQFCMTKYEATYPIFDKIHVKGKKANELFEFFSNKKKNGRFSATPKWNFQKYLVDKNGEVVNYYYSITNPTSNKIKKAIRKLL